MKTVKIKCLLLVDQNSIDGYIDMLSLLKDSSGQVPVFSDEGKFITYDTNHLTKSGAKYLGAIVFEKTELAILNK